MKVIKGVFSLILNVLWLVLSGIWLALGYAVGGVLMCLTIIGIPFGFQAFKFAAFSLWPFGKAVVDRNSGAFSTIFNVVWVILVGWWLALGHLIAGVLLCLTIIGIPFGLVTFRLAGLSLTPFGKRIMSADAAPEGAHTVRSR